jgi:hypothetical protein
MARKPSGRQAQDSLEAFLQSFENFVARVGAEAVEAAPKGEQQTLIQATSDSLIGQSNRVTAFVRQSAARLSPAQRGELEKFLQVQDGVAIANRGVAVTRQVLRSGVIGRLIDWISRHLKELKKILQELLKFICSLLHIPYPDWIDRLLQVLDQLLDLILSLLGEVFGLDFGRTARQLSEQEVDYFREWAAFEAVRVVRAERGSNAQDETV